MIPGGINVDDGGVRVFGAYTGGDGSYADTQCPNKNEGIKTGKLLGNERLDGSDRGAVFPFHCGIELGTGKFLSYGES